MLHAVSRAPTCFQLRRWIADRGNYAQWGQHRQVRHLSVDAHSLLTQGQHAYWRGVRQGVHILLDLVNVHELDGCRQHKSALENFADGHSHNESKRHAAVVPRMLMAQRVCSQSNIDTNPAHSV